MWTGSICHAILLQVRMRVTAQVRLQHAFRSEGGITSRECAFVGSFALGVMPVTTPHRVKALVLFELCRGTERLTAVFHVTHVGTVVGVDSQMALERAVRAELLGADGADEGLEVMR